MQYFITGAAGFIGSHLCHKLAKEGNKIIAVDSYSNYYDVGLKNNRVKALLEPLNIDVINLDITDDVKFDNLVSKSKPDVVINLAAQAGVRLPLKETDKYVNSNLVGFSNVLRSTVNNKVPYFLYASSSSVYGDKAAIPYIESEQNLHPTSFYGTTKLTNELLTPTLIQNSSTAARGLRFFTVYGPWGRPDMAYFRMIANAISGSEFNFFGDGSIERDFTFIEDVVNSVDLLSKQLQKQKPGFLDVVNLGGGTPLSMNYLLEIVGKLSNKDVEFTRRSGSVNDAKKTVSDSTYLQSLIEYKPSTKLADGILRTIEWALLNDIKPNLDSWVKSTQSYDL